VRIKQLIEIVLWRMSQVIGCSDLGCPPAFLASSEMDPRSGTANTSPSLPRKSMVSAITSPSRSANVDSKTRLDKRSPTKETALGWDPILSAIRSRSSCHSRKNSRRSPSGATGLYAPSVSAISAAKKRSRPAAARTKSFPENGYQEQEDSCRSKDALFHRSSIVYFGRATAGRRDWVHEIKFDGYRIQMRVESGEVTLKTRKGLDWAPKFGAIARAASKLPDCIVDGGNRRSRPPRLS
jgi:hypothetical protein